MTSHTPKSAQALYTLRLNAENPLRYFCPDSLEWLRQHPDLAEAWDACTRPAWLIWWLHDHLDLRSDGATFAFTDAYDLHFSSSDEDPHLADKVRALFTFWGEQRSPEAQ